MNAYLSELPTDVVRYIASFVYDRRGYNTLEYYKNKQLNKNNMARICIELVEWKKIECIDFVVKILW